MLTAGFNLMKEIAGKLIDCAGSNAKKQERFMNGKAIYDWTKESLLSMLAGKTQYSDGVYAIEVIQGFGSSIVVSVRSEGDKPVLIDLNGEKVETEVALFSLGEN